jgi:hypothetical protein
MPTTSIDREARQEEMRLEAERALEEFRRKEEAVRANFERLKAERLARESNK